MPTGGMLRGIAPEHKGGEAKEHHHCYFFLETKLCDVVCTHVSGIFGPWVPLLGCAGVFDLVGQILHAAISEANVLAKDIRYVVVTVD